MSKKEKTILYAICAVIVCAVVAVCVTQNTTGSREKEMKKLLANNWYRQWSESVSFTLYDDGTVTIPGSYGQGKWSLVNDDVLKISDFYGETMTLKIDDLDDQWLVVYEMENGQQSEEKITFWNTAEGAQTLRANLKLGDETMSDKMNRRKFLKLTGTVVLATSVAGALGGCSGGGSSAPTPPSPEEEGIAQIILDSINAARKEVGLDGTVQEVDKISQLSAQRALEMMNGKSTTSFHQFRRSSKTAERATSMVEGKIGQ